MSHNSNHTKEPSNVISTAIFVFIGALLLGWYNHINNLYPYYHSWDMDLLTTQDFLLLGSGLIPDHQVHPGVGMLAVLKFLAPLAQYFDLLAAKDFTEFAGAVNPLLIIANTASWVQSITPIVLFLIALTATYILGSYYELKATSTLFIFLLFGLATYTSIHLTYSRTEQYAILFWLIGLSFLLRRNIATKFLLLAGLFLGLAFFTKVQSLVLIVATLCFFAYVFYTNAQHIYFEQNTKNAGAHIDTMARQFHRLIKINFVLFLALSFLSYLVRVTEDIHHMRSGFGFTPWWLALFAFFGFSYFVSLKKPRWLTLREYTFVYSLGLVFIGFLSSLLVHFFIHGDFFIGLRHLLLTFKICLMGQFVPATVEQLAEINRTEQLLNHPLLIGLYIAAFILALNNVYRNRATLLPLMTSFALVLSLVLFLAHVLMATRNLNAQDLIWFEVPLLIFALFIAYDQMKHSKKQLGFAITTFAIIYIVHGALTSLNIGTKSLTGWTIESMFYKNVYGGNQDQIRDHIDVTFDPTVDRKVLSERVRNHKFDVQNWRYTLVDDKAAAQGIGYLLKNHFVLKSTPQLRAYELPPEWDGSSTYDLSFLLGNADSNWLSRIWSRFLSLRHYPVSADHIVINYKNDLKTTLFIEQAALPSACEALKRADCDPMAWSSGRRHVSFINTQNSEKVVFIAVPVFAEDEKSLRRQTILDKSRLKGKFFLALTAYAR